MRQSMSPSSVRATTAASENAYSPEDPDNKNSGRKAATVVTEETNSGKAYCSSGRQRGVLGRHAAVDPAHDVLHDDHAVVDQKAERNDDCGDRHLLDRNAERRACR